MTLPDIAIPAPLVFVGLVAKDGIVRFQHHRCTQAAAAIAFHVLFSIFPLVLLIAVVFGTRLRDPAVREQVASTLMTALPLASPDEGRISDLLLNATRNLTALGIVGGLGLIWSATGMLGSVRGAMELAWGGHHDTRPFLRGKLVDALLLAVIVSGVIAAFLLGLVVSVLPQVSIDWLPEGSWMGVADVVRSSIGPAISIAATTLVLLLAYKLLPTPRPELRFALVGAVIGSLVLEAARVGFQIYVDRVARFDVVYGSIGSIIVFLLFVYVTAIVILAGAELGAAARSVHHARTIVLGEAGDRGETA